MMQTAGERTVAATVVAGEWPRGGRSERRWKEGSVGVFVGEEKTTGAVDG